jgi:DNA topoisomerase-2
MKINNTNIKYKMVTKKVYTKKDPISHILDRSDMYVGSKKLKNISEFIAIKNEDSFEIVKKDIVFSPAILRIFVEVLSNAIDNVERSRKAKIPCTSIMVKVDKETGETSVWNDGDIVPIEMNEDENMYNHTLIFGNLLTGSNYDDEEERLISGRNGLGVKLASVFSTKFTVKGLDPNNKKVFEQTWTNNMKNIGEPKITETKLKKGFTKVTYFPDFKQFGLKGYTDDIINLYSKYVIDAAMLTKVKVYFNEELLNVNNLQTYSDLYESPSCEYLYLKNNNSEVLVTPSNINEFQ